MTPGAQGPGDHGRSAPDRVTLKVLPTRDKLAPYDTPAVRAAQHVGLIVIFGLAALEGIGHALASLGILLAALCCLELTRFDRLRGERLEGVLAGMVVVFGTVLLRMHSRDYDLSAQELRELAPVPLLRLRWLEIGAVLLPLMLILSPMCRLAWNSTIWRVLIGCLLALPPLLLLTPLSRGRPARAFSQRSPRACSWS